MVAFETVSRGLALASGMPSLRTKIFASNEALKIVGDFLPARNPNDDARPISNTDLPRSFVYLHGLKSTRSGRKSDLLVEKMGGFASVARFDFRGHGDSEGTLENDLAASGLLSDCCGVLDEADGRAGADFDKRHVLVGSSMGGFVALWTAALYPERVAGIVLLAPAVAMKEFLAQNLNPDDGGIEIPSAWVPEGAIHMGPQFLKDFEIFEHFMSSKDFATSADLLASVLISTMKRVGRVIPIYCAHGGKDDVLDWKVTEKFMKQLADAFPNESKFVFRLVKDGDHRLAEDSASIYNEAILHLQS